MNTSSRNRTIPISVIILVAVSTMQLSSMITLNDNVIVDNVYAKYSSNSHAQSLSNECAKGESSGTNCGANGQQVLADGSANTATNSQTARGGDQVVTPEPPADLARLTVIKIVNCEGIGAGECPPPSAFTMTVDGVTTEPSFPGSSTGTTINIAANTPYSVGELDPILLPGVELEDPTFSEQCSGQVAVGNTETCTVTNLVGSAG